MPSRVFVFHVEAMRIVLGASAPDFGWETVLVQAIRQYYAGATQGRWVQVVASELTELHRRFERWSVLTTRQEVLHVLIREVPAGGKSAHSGWDPPEVLAALERRRLVLALVEQAEVAEHELRVMASA